MNVRRAMQFLSLPAALALGTALVVACSSESPTESTVGQEPVQVGVPMAVPKKHSPSQYDALNGSGTDCVLGYHLEEVNPGSGADDNGDGWICKKGVIKKK